MPSDSKSTFFARALPGFGRRARLLGSLTLLYGLLAFGALWLGDAVSPTFRAARDYYTPEAVRGYSIPGPGATWRRPERPPDPWGKRWVEEPGSPVRSCGPNGLDEGGGGDDIVLTTQPVPVAYPAVYVSALPLPCWWALALCVGLGHLARAEVAGHRRGVSILVAGLGAGLALLGAYQVLDRCLWIQSTILSGWVSPPKGQLGYLLESEYATSSGILPSLGIPEGRAPWILAGSAWGVLFLWIECCALAAARLHQRYRTSQGSPTDQGSPTSQVVPVSGSDNTHKPMRE